MHYTYFVICWSACVRACVLCVCHSSTTQSRRKKAKNKTRVWSRPYFFPFFFILPRAWLGCLLACSFGCTVLRLDCTFFIHSHSIVLHLYFRAIFNDNHDTLLTHALSRRHTGTGRQRVRIYFFACNMYLYVCVCASAIWTLWLISQCQNNIKFQHAEIRVCVCLCFSRYFFSSFIPLLHFKLLEFYFINARGYCVSFISVPFSVCVCTHAA